MKPSRAVVIAGALVGGWLLAGIALAGGPDPVAGRPVEVPPGASVALRCGGRAFQVTVPAGPDESLSIGTFAITEIDGDYRSGPIERDGALQTIFEHDVDGDGVEDALLVVRCAGSSSAVTLYLLRIRAGLPQLERLPEPAPALLSGYQGHDAVTIVDGSITRRFPTYRSTADLRVDRQWTPVDTLHGQLPLKREPDSNAAPSGGDRELRYDIAALEWRSVD